MIEGAGCRVQGAGCRVQGSGCRVQGSGFRVQGSGCRCDLHDLHEALEEVLIEGCEHEAHVLVARQQRHRCFAFCVLGFGA